MVEFRVWKGKPPSGWRRNIDGHCGGNSRSGGGWGSSTYQSWYNMVLRTCFEETSNPNVRYYTDIRPFYDWVDTSGPIHPFLVFLEFMGERPEGTTLDRIDPYGHYVPGNLRWATPTEQASNKKKSKRKRA